MRRKKWLLSGLIILAVIILILSTTRINYDDGRGLWNLDSLGVLSLTCLNDQAKGMVCWFYVQDAYVGQWPVKRNVASPTPYPTSSPYPTATPYPTYTPSWLQSA